MQHRLKVEQWKLDSTLFRIVAEGTESKVVGYLEPSSLFDGKRWVAWMIGHPIFVTHEGFVDRKWFRGFGEAKRIIESCKITITNSG